MLSYLQRIGKSLMLPVAVLPVAAILMGLGYWIDPSGWGANSALAAVLLSAGSAIIDNMGILFALGVGVGMSKDNHGAAALTALVGWLVVQKMLDPATISLISGTPAEEVNVAFTKINTQFIGILVGIVSAEIYNRTYKVQLPVALSFFSGRRLAPIVTSLMMLVVCAVLLFAWPIIYTGLVNFGEMIMSMGAVGAGIFGFCNRLLIPLGLHHALNSVFWFDVAGINDIPNYLSGVAPTGMPEGYTAGMYQAGFFPIMMFGLPAAAYAMYRESMTKYKAQVGGLMLGGAVAAFFVGVTEPLEFSFMFAAPLLYLWHAFLTGISMFIAAQMQWIAGFGFSAGFVDFILSFKNPLATQNVMLLLQGIVFGLIYFFSFTFLIRKFDIPTPGRREGDFDDEEAPAAVEAKDSKGTSKTEKYDNMAKKIVAIVGEDNLVEVNNCTTRLRLVVKDSSKLEAAPFKSMGIIGVVKPSNTDLQLIVGPDVEFAATALKELTGK